MLHYISSDITVGRVQCFQPAKSGKKTVNQLGYSPRNQFLGPQAKKNWLVSGAPGDEKIVHPGGRKNLFLNAEMMFEAK